jgi:predicted  nucleic acid-binding Zn-ribbon protein
MGSAGHRDAMTQDSLLDRLVAAYVAASEAEAKLARARKLFAATHTGPALESLRKAAQTAEERELAFQAEWREAQRTLLGVTEG